MRKYKSTIKEVNALYKAEKTIHNVKVNSSMVVNDFIRKVYPVDITYREAMVVLYLNNANRTLSYSIASIGSINGTLADIRLILRDALLSLATNMILIHNHPSGNLEPSNADKLLTKKVKEAANLMDIRLLDHLIITENSYKSFADDGIL